MDPILFIYIMLFSFIFIIITSLIYLVYVDWLNIRFKRRIGRITNDYEKTIKEGLNQVELSNQVSDHHVKVILHKNKSQSYERVFQNVMIEYASDQKNRHRVVLYMINFEAYVVRKTKMFVQKDSVKHIQNIFLLGEYRLSNQTVLDYLLKCVKSNSISTKFNSLSAISKIGDAAYLVRALVITSDNKGYLNQKVLTDILDSFEGEKDELVEQLTNSLLDLSDVFRRLVINYFSNQVEEKPAAILVDVLKRQPDKEEYIMILKYFSNILYPNVVTELLNATQHDMWEIRAISSRTLKLYSDYYEVEDVLPVLSDANWHVRTNIAGTVVEYIDFNQSNQEQTYEKILESMTDQYAIDALEYARQLKDGKEEGEAGS